MSIKKIVYLLGMAFIFSAFLCFCHLFIVAYLDPAKAIIIHINRYHEANLELSFVIFGLIMFIPMFWLNVKTITEMD